MFGESQLAGKERSYSHRQWVNAWSQRPIAKVHSYLIATIGST